MHITEIRIAGFKSFVDPTTVMVEPGLTGIVGPNGCGKSNLLEALRWAMGANSARAMRGGEMDDLIFSGSEGRPAREIAEVTLVLDNSDRRAPPAFNDTDVLEVTRRLKRGAGSTYKINGRTVRGKDIQLIFADASTGANSPALVRQGQISELIGSKPQNRRRILEEAAGIAGLNTRRHEAELRLRAAEANLERLTEVSAEVERQLESLKRQARKARKYKELSEEIQSLDALVAHLRWTAAKSAQVTAAETLETCKADVERLTREAALADNAALKARDGIAPLRETEATEAAKVGQVRIQLAKVEAERRAASDALSRLKTELDRLASDITTEEETAADARRTVEELTDRLARLERPDPEREKREDDEARARLSMATQALADAETRLDAANTALATRRAEIEASRARYDQLSRRRAQLDGERARLAQALDVLPKLDALEGDTARIRSDLEANETEATTAEQALREAEAALDSAQTTFESARADRDTADQPVRELEAEARGLERLLTREAKSSAPPVIDEMTITNGYEKAVAAALGDDLNASRDRDAALFWSGDRASSLPALPGGARPLSEFVDAPDALSARLSQCGLVDASDGPRLRSALQTGQRLVSREGHLWRWDGFTRTPAAPLSEAERLRQRARLDEVERQLQKARAAQSERLAAFETASTALNDARSKHAGLKSRPAELARTVSALKERLIRSEQAIETARLRRSGGEENLARVTSELEAVTVELAEVPAPGDMTNVLAPLQSDLDATRDALRTAREDENRARTAIEELRRAREQSEGRRRGITRDLEDWTRRRERSDARLEELRRRHAETSDLFEKAETPDGLVEEAERLSSELEKLESVRKAAADAVAEAETELRETEFHARRSAGEASGAREALAAAKVTLDSAAARLSELDESIRHQFSRAPDGLPVLASSAIADRPIEEIDLHETERQLDRLKLEREALGGVNLEAEDEVTALEERLGGQRTERDDLIAAIAKLREGVDALNAEGRERLLVAFEQVNSHFQTLFTTLFRGGQAELRLIDADDPLAAGLEIFAQPPGKRLGTLSLMSGGEQALTATALIFAVFLSNPAPICVLDEVDAPLDDANVDRYCRLLDEMRHRTDTRFVAITHNAVTMSRMDRLFGVTMREKGVSKLVSVDLQSAEELVAAE